jgi:hypothetical protein
MQATQKKPPQRLLLKMILMSRRRLSKALLNISITIEQLYLYAKGLSLLNKAQCYAKAARSGDIANLIDS